MGGWKLNYHLQRRCRGVLFVIMKFGYHLFGWQTPQVHPPMRTYGLQIRHHTPENTFTRRSQRNYNQSQSRIPARAPRRRPAPQPPSCTARTLPRQPAHHPWGEELRHNKCTWQRPCRRGMLGCTQLTQRNKGSLCSCIAPAASSCTPRAATRLPP